MLVSVRRLSESDLLDDFTATSTPAGRPWMRVWWLDWASGHWLMGCGSWGICARPYDPVAAASSAATKAGVRDSSWEAPLKQAE